MERTISAKAIIKTNKGNIQNYGRKSGYYCPVVTVTNINDITNLFRANSSISSIDVTKEYGDLSTERHRVVTTYYYSSLRQRWEPQGKILSLYKNGNHICKYIDFN